MLVPDVALGTSQEGRYLLVVGADNVVQRKIVKTGDREGAYRIIESGIDPGDWVVTEGVQRALPGAKVDPQRRSSAKLRLIKTARRPRHPSAAKAAARAAHGSGEVTAREKRA